MSRGIRLLFVFLGIAGLAWLVREAGIDRLTQDAERTGWMFVPILLLYGVAYLCYTWAWQLIMAEEPRQPSFSRLYAITISAFSLDFVTPMLNVGGEPFRIGAVAPWVGRRRALGGVVIYKMLHALALAIVWIVGLALAFFMLPSQASVVVPLLVGTVFSLGLAVVLLILHRRGGLERLLGLMTRVPLLRRWTIKLEQHRELLTALDRQIVDFHEHDRGRFYAALGVEVFGRIAYLVEYYLIFASLDLGVGSLHAFVIGSLASLMMTATFFVPFELGTKEASHYMLFDAFGLDPSLGVYTAMVSRARDLTWIAIGLALVWVSGARAPASESAAREAA